MKPAISVLVFTVLSGAGYGLLVWLITIQLLTTGRVDLQLGLVTAAMGLLLVTVGLLSSTLHLANPKNAWRAFNRFRTSWLSREGVFAVLFYPLFLSYGLALWLNQGQIGPVSTVLGVASLIVALVTVYCTGMIYASLKPIRQWHNPLTTPIYLLLSLTSGAWLLLVLYLAVPGLLPAPLVFAVVSLSFVSAAAKLLYFQRIGKAQGTSINQATGFSQGAVRLLDAGHTSETFLTREFQYQTDAAGIQRLRTWMLLFCFLLPPAILILVNAMPLLAVLVYLAPIFLFSGLLLERWLFFAEARHVVRLYHGEQIT